MQHMRYACLPGCPASVAKGIGNQTRKAHPAAQLLQDPTQALHWFHPLSCRAVGGFKAMSRPLYNDPFPNHYQPLHQTFEVACCCGACEWCALTCGQPGQAHVQQAPPPPHLLLLRAWHGRTLLRRPSCSSACSRRPSGMAMSMKEGGEAAWHTSTPSASVGDRRVGSLSSRRVLMEACMKQPRAIGAHHKLPLIMQHVFCTMMMICTMSLCCTVMIACSGHAPAPFAHVPQKRMHACECHGLHAAATQAGAQGSLQPQQAGAMPQVLGRYAASQPTVALYTRACNHSKQGLCPRC